MMDLTIERFHWDAGNWPKCAKHGLSKPEVEYALRNDPLVLIDRGSRAETRFNAVGRNKAGRHLFVVFTLRRIDGTLLVRPISARYMHEKEVRVYEQIKKT
jgi:uncharacterized protein